MKDHSVKALVSICFMYLCRFSDVDFRSFLLIDTDRSVNSVIMMFIIVNSTN